MEAKLYDFEGWATKNDLKCADGRTIKKNAFQHNDGKVVPLVWNHQYSDPLNVLGHALLENRDDGVYAHCSFNDTESGVNAKKIVQHGDVASLSIFANQLTQQLGDVLHGDIKEVSLVLAGANPGAVIESVQHGADFEFPDEMIFSSGDSLNLCHSEEPYKEDAPKDEKKDKETEDKKEPEKTSKTIGEVFDSMNEEQKNIVYAIAGQIAADAKSEDSEAKHGDMQNNQDLKGGTTTMKPNAFDKDTQLASTTLSHSDMAAILSDAKRYGTLKEAFIQHGISEETLQHSVTDAGGNNVTYGVANIDYLFPDARTVNNVPDFISRNMDWVAKVVSDAKHIPFSRVKSIHANITMDEARAKGYVKGNQKADEVFALLKRTTSPTTIYKKQKIDRDDIVDIVDFDVVAWLKHEMRMMLDEEIARAALIGDGRQAGTDDKISAESIRPIWTDSDTYTVKAPVTVDANATDEDKAKAFIRKAIKSRKDYKGSGNPTLFTTEDVLTDCLLLEDGNGRVIYETVDKLKTALRVKEIITVPVMESKTRTGSGADANYTFTLMGLIVNMADYGFGADKGGAVNMFDDFDIDYNQQKYLIETRCSGALMKPYSAIALELKTATNAG